MSHVRYFIALLLLLAMTASAGCAATPQDRWYQQRQALNTANQIYLANVPQMGDQEIVHHGQLLQAARTALEQAQTHLPEGGRGFDNALDVVESLLMQLAAPHVKTDASAAAPVPEASITRYQGDAHDPR